MNGPVGVALGDDGYIYWIEANANTIKRRSLASGTVTTLLSGLSSPNYIAIVPTSAKMYWTEIGIPKIKMADLTGTNVQTLGITVTHPNGIAATSSPLPIQLASFNGTVQGNLVVVDWRTASEVNNYGFFIQKKQNGETDWSEVSNSFVPGHGTTNMPQHYSFTDNTAVAGVILYRLKQVDLDGAIHFSELIQINGVTGMAEVAPLQFALQQNYRNPLNPTTTIAYALAHLVHVTLIVYNTLGEQVAQLVNEQQTSGHHHAVFNGDRLSSGVYFYRLQAGDHVATKQLLLLK